MTFKFKVCPWGNRPPVESDLVALEASDWDDYSHELAFRVSVVSGGRYRTVGETKILPRDLPEQLETVVRARDSIDDEFDALDSEEYVSVGQTLSFYEELTLLLGSTAAMELVRSLADLAVTPVPRWVGDEQQTAFVSSVVRYPSARKSITLGARVLGGATAETAHGEGQLLRYVHGPERIVSFELEATINFGVKQRLPGRIHAIVGKNGSGKTSFVRGVADAFRNEATSQITSDAGRILVISFNPFDASIPIKADDYSVFVHQLRPVIPDALSVGLEIDLPEALDRLEEAVGAFADSGQDDSEDDRLATLRQHVEILDAVRKQLGRGLLDVGYGLPVNTDSLVNLAERSAWREFLREGFEDPALDERLADEPLERLKQLSAGQQSLVLLYATVYNSLTLGDLVIIDEPENHLHPSLLSEFVANLHRILEDRASFGLLITHSPVIVQELPASQVHVFIADHVKKQTLVETPPFQTFGESLDVLTEYLFEAKPESSLWKRTSVEAVRDGSDEALVQALRESGGFPPMTTRMFLAQLKRRRDGGDDAAD